MPVAWTLLGLALIVALASALTIWVKRQALVSERWAETSVELLRDEEVRGAVSTYVAGQVFAEDRVDRLRGVLPDNLRPLAAPLAGALEQLAAEATDRLLASAPVQQVWEEANLRAHEDLLAILDGDSGSRISAEDGQVVLDLRPLVDRVRDRLGVTDPADPDAGRIVLLESDQIGAAQDGVRALRALSVVLALVFFALLALAIWLGAGRRRTMVLAAGAGLVVVGLILLVARRIAGEAVVDALVVNPTTEGAFSNVWLIGTSLLRDLGVALIAYGALAVVGALLAGPAGWALSLRRRLAPALGNPWAVHGVAAAVLLIILAAAPLGTGRRLLGTLILAAIVLGGVEVYRRLALREAGLRTA